jgi:sporulation protein YlmC with PRC-barrel domain
MKWKRKQSALLLVPALGFALALPAAAAGSSADKATGNVVTTRVSAFTVVTSNAGAQQQYEVRASKLIGMEVRNAQGEDLGEVKDVIIDTRNERARYAVLSFGGLAGIGNKLFAVPVSQLRPAENKLVFDVDRKKLESLPGYEPNRSPDWNDPGDRYRAQLDRRFGEAGAQAGAPLRQASRIMDAEVNDRNGREIGDVEDIVVHMPSGRVHYVVVEFDRAWNPNDKLVALPLRALDGGMMAATVDRDTATTGNRTASAPRDATTNAKATASPDYDSLRGGASVAAPNTSGGGDRTAAGAVVRPGGGVAGDYADRDPATRGIGSRDLVYEGTREQLRNAPEFDKDRYPDLSDATRREAFDQRLSNW